MIKWVNSHKHLSITILISLLVLIILTVLCYIIYVYGYYDNQKENTILENINSFKFNKVYDDLYLKDNNYLTKNTFTYMTDIMFNKKNLEKIYDNYYKNNNKYKGKEEFVKRYYYGYKELTIKDIEFYYKGSTNFFSRRLTKAMNYIVTNGNKEQLKLGIIDNITITTNSNSKIKIDNNPIICNNVCNIAKLYSGIHSIEYIKDGYTYYTLYPIVNNNTSINLNNISTLVAISEEVDMNIFDDIDLKNIELSVGIYSLTTCNNNNCPLKNYSYIVLNNDKTFSYYVYTDINKNPNVFSGTYRIENAFLTLIYQNYKYTNYTKDGEKDITTIFNKTETYNIYNKTKFYNESLEFEIKT